MVSQFICRYCSICFAKLWLVVMGTHTLRWQLPKLTCGVLICRSRSQKRLWDQAGCHYNLALVGGTLEKRTTLHEKSKRVNRSDYGIMVSRDQPYWAALQSRLVCAANRQNRARIKFLVPLSRVIAKLLIFEGKGWVISDKNYGKGTKTKMLEHQTANYS